MNGEEQKLDAGADRGVSPAIAVLLMAAVTIIIAAVIGAFVLGVGGQTEEPAPTVSADIERGPGVATSDNERVFITHEGGDNVPVSELRIVAEARCFDSDLLVDNTKRGEAFGFPVGGLSGIQSSNVNGDNIFQPGGSGTSAPLSGAGGTWTAGEALEFEIDNDECEVPSDGRIDVQVVHEPSNSIISDQTSGGGFEPVTLQDEVEPATAGATSSHTFVLKNINYGTSGDEVDKITVDYDPNNNGVDADFNGIDNSNVDVTMTRTLSSGPDRSSINLNDPDPTCDCYKNSDATIDLSGFSTTDVAGPISIEINDIKNPTSAGTYDVEITLTGDAGQKTFTKTINIE